MLSDEQIWQLASQEGDTHDDSFIFNRDGRWSVLSFARAIERALSQSTEQGERDAAKLGEALGKVRNLAAHGSLYLHEKQYGFVSYALTDIVEAVDQVRATLGSETDRGGRDAA